MGRTFLKLATGGMYSLIFLKLKLKTNSKQSFQFVTIVLIKNRVAHFLKIKNIFQNVLLRIFFFVIVLLCIRKVYANFLKIVIFKVSLIF